MSAAVSAAAVGVQVEVVVHEVNRNSGSAGPAPSRGSYGSRSS